MWAELWRERRKRRRVLLVLVGVCSACLNQPSDALTTTRYIDTICSLDHYSLQGSARRTTGLTDDACGFVLGPGAGKVVFEIPEADLQPHGGETSSVSALLRSTTDDAMGWQDLSIDSEAEKSATSSSSPTYYSFSSSGSEIEIIDVRIVAYPEDDANCD